MSIREQAEQAREQAQSVLRRHQKLASFDLYKVLASCYALSAECRRSNSAQQELRAMITQNTQQRSYVERGSDENTLVCRFVFAGDESRANISRYASTLREASKRDIIDLFTWLCQNGGVNALWMSRPNQQLHVTTRCLRLDRSVTIPKTGAFTLTLERGADNVYIVRKEPDEV